MLIKRLAFMKGALVIAAVLVVAALTGIVSMTTAFASFTCTHAVCAATKGIPKGDDDDKGNAKVKITNKQSIVANGETVYAQNCVESNVNSQVTSGDEGVDCHNNQLESEIQNQSESE